MDRKSFAAIFVFGASIAIGISSDLLLKGVSWGINVPIWTAFLLYVVHLTLKTRDRRGIRPHLGLAIPIMLFAALFAWRDSPTLKLLDGLALFILIALLAARIRFEWAPWQSFCEYMARIGQVLNSALLGPTTAIRNDIEWSRFRNEGLRKTAESVARGLAIAMPVAAVFTVLLAMADSRFEGILKNAVTFDFGSGLGHLLAISLCAWLAAGALREVAQPESAEVRCPKFSPALGPVEIGILLGMVNLLFATFVFLQIPYLFGGFRGAETSVAEYARRGFFELVWVSILVLPLLLHSHALLRNAGQGGEQVYRGLAGVMILLMFVIIASAAHRMVLYRNAFGLTELRFYTSAFMCWLTIVFGWFVPTVLWGLRQRFMFGAFVSALVTIPVLHAVNPDAAIVRENAARLRDGKPFDWNYNRSLSADAVPELLKAMAQVHFEETEAARANLWSLRKALEGDWREWSLSRATASRLLRELREPEPQREVQNQAPYPRSFPEDPLIRHVPFYADDRDRLRVLAVPDGMLPEGALSVDPESPLREGIGIR